MATVLLSYRHETQGNPNHMKQVREFAERLRKNGIDVILDQFANDEEFSRGGPPDGWERWSYDQVDLADKILLIGSPAYFRVYENAERPGTGIGAAIEAQRIFTQLCKQKGENPRFRVVFLNEADECDVPDHLSGYHRFHFHRSPQEFSDIVSWIKGPHAGDEMHAPAPAVSWPAIVTGYEADLANRNGEFSFFVDLIAGLTTERALFFEAPSNYGKTLLLAECVRYAAQLFESGIVKVDFKGNPTRDFVLDTLRLELADRLPVFQGPRSTAYDLRADLRNVAAPVVLLFDTYERANGDAHELIEGLLLADIDRLSAVRVVIAGQAVPDYKRALWSAAVRHFKLGPITDPQFWRKFAEHHYATVTPDHVEALTLGSAGIPGVVRPMLQTLAAALETTYAESD